MISMVLEGAAKPGTPPGGRYALGWGEVGVDWAPRPLLSRWVNGMNVAHVWLEPARDVALVLLTNIAAPAEAGLRAAAAEPLRVTWRPARRPGTCRGGRTGAGCEAAARLLRRRHAPRCGN